MKYHYSGKEGWLGNPCGLVYFKDKYHLFFQINPLSFRYGPMHWGHAISDDLITWEDCPVAISPKNELSCNSGSVITFDGKLWIFYTSLSMDNRESICAAVSEDGVNFTKFDNPVVTAPFEGNCKFRDPCVMRYGSGFRMFTGAGKFGVAKVLQYESDDLINWKYMGELLSDGRYGSVIEAPHMIETDGKWIFMIQSERHVPTKVLFATGSYDGEHFIYDDENEPFKSVDSGFDFLNPVIAKDKDGRIVLMAWLFSMKMNSAAISAPRELFISRTGEVCMLPYGNLRNTTVKESSFVCYDQGRLRVQFQGHTLFDKAYRECPEISVIEDVGMVEIFLDGGREMISMFVC